MIVKVCGITNLEDARMVLEAGADWIGLNLVAGPRRIELDTVKRIIAGLDDPSRVVVLLAAELGRVSDVTLGVLRDHGVRRVQLYGEDRELEEAVAQLRGVGLESIAVVHVRGDQWFDCFGAEWVRRGADRPAYVLLDSGGPGRLGGTGTPADWDAIALARLGGRLSGCAPILLAGGLTPGNVAHAIQRVQPDGVDVSSGVERSPGRKDRAKVEAFIEAARTDSGSPLE